MVVKADESTDPVPTVYSELHSGRVRHVGVTCVIRQLILCILTTAAGANLKTWLRLCTCYNLLTYL